VTVRGPLTPAPAEAATPPQAVPLRSVPPQAAKSSDQTRSARAGVVADPRRRPRIQPPPGVADLTATECGSPSRTPNGKV
jgi:hypothetical protein